MGSSPGGEIKILHATQQVQKKKKKKKHKSVCKFALKVISYQRPKLDVIVCTHLTVLHQKRAPSFLHLALWEVSGRGQTRCVHTDQSTASDACVLWV